MTLKLKNPRWEIAEPWTVTPGQTVRVMIAGTTKKGRYRFRLAKITRLLKSGWSVEIKLPSGEITTRDIGNVAVRAREKPAKRKHVG